MYALIWINYILGSHNESDSETVVFLREEGNEGEPEPKPEPENPHRPRGKKPGDKHDRYRRMRYELGGGNE